MAVRVSGQTHNHMLKKNVSGEWERFLTHDGKQHAISRSILSKDSIRTKRVLRLLGRTSEWHSIHLTKLKSFENHQNIIHLRVHAEKSRAGEFQVGNHDRRHPAGIHLTQSLWAVADWWCQTASTPILHWFRTRHVVCATASPADSGGFGGIIRFTRPAQR